MNKEYKHYFKCTDDIKFVIEGNINLHHMKFGDVINYEKFKDYCKITMRSKTSNIDDISTVEIHDNENMDNFDIGYNHFIKNLWQFQDITC